MVDLAGSSGSLDVNKWTALASSLPGYFRQRVDGAAPTTSSSAAGRTWTSAPALTNPGLLHRRPVGVVAASKPDNKRGMYSRIGVAMAGGATGRRARVLAHASAAADAEQGPHTPPDHHVRPTAAELPPADAAVQALHASVESLGLHGEHAPWSNPVVAAAQRAVASARTHTLQGRRAEEDSAAVRRVHGSFAAARMPVAAATSATKAEQVAAKLQADRARYALMGSAHVRAMVWSLGSPQK